MKYRLLLILLTCCYPVALQAQRAKRLIRPRDVSRIEKVLADDRMQGRRTFTPGLERASRFIENQFGVIGLDTLKTDKGYSQPFTLSFIEPKSIDLTLDQIPVPSKDVIVRSLQPRLDWTNRDSCELMIIGPGEDLFARMRTALRASQNTLVLVDSSYKERFYEVRKSLNTNNTINPLPNSTLFILHSGRPQKFAVHIVNHRREESTHNIVGILPGKIFPGEFVIFSAHYDHLGIGKPIKGDSIYNGANDDASGTTAVLELAKYYKAAGNNARTLIFVAFTGEEEGGYGSSYFATRINADSIVAMSNIEMIGTKSKWGSNSAYITGFDKTDFGKIIQKAVQGTPYRFYPDPYPSQQLFYRSDNASLAKLGVPAHTISTSKMDNEPYYHQVTDDINTLDINNMTAIIRAIAQGMTGIVAGKETPSRLAPQSLKR